MVLLKHFKCTFLFVVFTLISCASKNKKNATVKKTAAVVEQAVNTITDAPIITGAQQVTKYLPFLQNKRVGVVTNQTGVIDRKNGGYTHLVDSLLKQKVNITKVFAPEHGFRGKADAGAYIKNGKDLKTGLPIVSLYGKNKKPTRAQLQDVDIMVFDIQDVGARFYTYISTLHYVMEACAEKDIILIILDRPNPNGHYVDGPVLQATHKSFVGMHPVPIVHGMTIAEYAKMINAQNWLSDDLKCKILLITCKNYTKDKPYSLPIAPSPNLPNDVAVNLYPSLCLFEGTNVNAGRGTTMQFQVYGAPDMEHATFSYVPKSRLGASSPKHQDKICYGQDLRDTPRGSKLELKWLIDAFDNTTDKDKFFNSFFTKLAGTTVLQKKIEKGYSEKMIRKDWERDLAIYKKMKAKYEIY